MGGHTEGPWERHDRADGGQGVYDKGTRNLVALVNTRHDARLIAAAPDMLAALKAVDALGMLNPTGAGTVEDAARAVKAAIAKATT